MNKSLSTDEDSIIIGVDPGTRISGYGIITFQKNAYIPIDYGCIRPPPSLKLSERYLIIFNAIDELITKFKPSILAIETQFVQKNVHSTLKLVMARTAVMIAAKKQGLSIFEYAPSVAKRAVTGYGKSSKFQVQGMVQRLLKLPSPPEPEDAADALALAICHVHSSRLGTGNEI